MSTIKTREWLNNYVEEVKEVAEELLDVLVEHPQNRAAPSLIMAIVSVAKGLEEENIMSFDEGINMMQEGIAALVHDVKKMENLHGH
jgi:hypothetical protein